MAACWGSEEKRDAELENTWVEQAKRTYEEQEILTQEAEHE